ncbi:MAG TPA: prolyl-tRNA synthetase associated domain-containing protein [Chloroflexi bacterium]|nr:prolyl-tRNA synthetase associated domain-containing protein [Chloroflexota bacterium]
MTVSYQTLFEILKKLDISYEHIEHPPVFTSEQAGQSVPANRGVPAKNLFLRDKKGKRHFLVMLNDSKDLDLAALAQQTGSSRLSLASPERLHSHLGIEPGAVSPLALINDPDRKIELWIDQDLWQADSIQCHPLVNTATWILTPTGLTSFLQQTGHPIHFFTT